MLAGLFYLRTFVRSVLTRNGDQVRKIAQNCEVVPRMSFSFSEAAILSGYGDDERLFRSLVESGAVLATPETRSYGRGKAKLFDKDEIGIACIINQIGQMLNPMQRTQIADYIRKNLSAIERHNTEAHPYYLVVETNGGSWACQFTPTIDYSGELCISVMMPDPNDLEAQDRPARRLIAVNIRDALHIINNDEIVAMILAPTREG